MNKTVRVRFAPSPTGPLHIGGVRTALYNYLFAKKHQGTFILRIEDTDQARYVKGAEEYIQEALAWCGLNHDEGVGVGGEMAPYRQSERKEIYQKHMKKLIEKGHAYYAFDTTEELDAFRGQMKTAQADHQQYDATTRMTMNNSLTLSKEEVTKKIAAGEPYVIRVKTPTENKEIVFHDSVRGEIKVATAYLDDKVLMKADGMPTYHLANVVDDYLMQITHVIRGEEWLPSAPLHVFLYQCFGWEEHIPQFAHLPLILKPTGKGKLSKRDGDQLGFPVFPLTWKDEQTGETASGFREEGYLKEAFINMLAFLGWNPGTEKELFSLEELVEEFSLNKVGKAGARFDPDKTKWFNQQYLKTKSDEELALLLKPYFEKAGIVVKETYLQDIGHLLKERVSLLKEFTQHNYLFSAPTSYHEKTLKKKWKEETPLLMVEVMTLLQSFNDFSAQQTENSLNSWIEKQELSHGDIMPGLRLLITGQGGGPSLFEIMELLGKEETLNRIKSGLETLATI